MDVHIVRGPLLNPRPDGTVDFIPNGALMGDAQGRIAFVGAWDALRPQLGKDGPAVTPVDGLILPPLLDCHTHIPQHPIRGRFTEGIDDDPPEGRLLAGLNRNVFPAEARAAHTEYAQQVVQDFHQDTLAQGVVGGAAFMTVHAGATRAALASLPDTWSVGLVLMNQNCPRSLRTDAENWERDVDAMAADFGRRLIVTDRFAVSVDTPLRRRASEVAARLGLRMQTHLNEQRTEKAFVEDELYPQYASYTDVYKQDGLLDRDPILAHCIHMTPAEWDMISGASVAHCPTSNTLLGSGTMDVDTVRGRRLPYALCTDVGASPTTSLLAEMAQFLTVHAGRSRYATPSEALWRVTLGPAQILGLDTELGTFAVGRPLSYVVAEAFPFSGTAANDAIGRGLLGMPPAPPNIRALNTLASNGLPHGPDLLALTADVHGAAARLEGRVRRVVLHGATVWQHKQ